MSDRPAQRLLGRAGRSAGGPAGRGFTLIELMVVVAILAILTTLIVSVSSFVRTKAMQDDTQANMKIIMSAIMAFQNATDKFPTSTVPGNPHAADTEQAESENLYDQLHKIPQCRQILQNLPPNILVKTGTYPDGTPKIMFVDSFATGKPMDYYGSLAGRPTLVSAGKDGDFSKDVDNISSND